MTSTGWRRLGIGPAAFVVFGLAAIAMLLSRGAGSGWLVVVAAVLLGGLVFAALAAAIGMVGLRVQVDAPTDAVAGETITIELTVSSWIPQLRTVTLLSLDRSTHAVVSGAPALVPVHAARRGFHSTLPLEVRGGLPLGLFRPARRFSHVLPTPLAIGPVPAIASLIDTIGEDPTAEVRTVRAYAAGDPARLVHWRSTARRGELMVRELESAELLRGARLQIRVELDAEADRADATASHAAGLAIAALDAGLVVHLLTAEPDGARAGEVRTRRDVGRRLAAATSGVPAEAKASARLVDVGP